MIKVSDYVMEFIANLGVKDVFFLSGGGCMHLVDSLGRNQNLTRIANLHEQCATIGAGGYSQYTGNIGVALVTTGPGGTNAITGVAASWIDGNPMLVISGQVKKADLMVGRNIRQMGPQEVDIISMVKPITKYAVTIMEPKEIRRVLEEAVYWAKEGRMGPVWIDIPLDIQGAMIEESDLIGFEQPQTIEYDEIDYQKIYDLINQSKRPVMLIGNGARAEKAYQHLIELAERLNIPILTTWRSLDIIEEEHEMYFGRPGAIGQRCANFIQQNSDLFISIGARLDLGQIAFDYKNLARAAKKIVVDIDPYEIKKIDTKIDLPIVVSANLFGETMLSFIGLAVKNNRDEWLTRCRKYKNDFPIIPSEHRNSQNNVNTYILLEELSNQLTTEDVIVPGSSGTCSEIASQCFKLKKGQRFINSPGLGSMGFGIAESIGVCVASGGKRTVCLIGDGGIQHNIQELELLKRYQLPIKVFVLNNNGYASIRSMQERNFEGRLYGCDESNDVTLPDTLQIAEAYGLNMMKIDSHHQISMQVKEVLDTFGPVICEVIIDRNFVTEARTMSVMLEDGNMVSKPMEDLWPFLDRSVFEENMIIETL